MKALELKVVQIKCNSTINPIGVDTDYPNFGWITESQIRDNKQSAYQIIVADTQQDINKCKYNLKVKIPFGSEASVNILTNNIDKVKESHSPASETKGINYLKMEGNMLYSI